jgi:hypothetical protein
MIGSDAALPTLARPEALLALERAFASGGETGALMRTLDWSASPCGPILSWSPGLRNAVIACLGMGMPTMVVWGPEYALLYNDAVIPVLPAKHPWAMGRPLRETFPEVLNIVVPLIEVVLQTGRPVAFQDSKVIMRRNARLESGYFTFSLSRAGYFLIQSSGESIGVVQAAEYRLPNVAEPLTRPMRRRRTRNPLPQSLMRSLLIEVFDVLIEHSKKMALTKDEHVVEAFTAHAADEALADRVGVRRTKRCLQDFHSSAFGNTIEFLPELVVAIADEEPRAHAVGRKIP